MALLGKDQIFAIDDRKVEEVYVDEWKGHVRVRSLTGRERDKFEAEIAGDTSRGKKKPNTENFRARLISLCVLEPEGDRLMFASRQEVQMLGNKSVAALQVIFNKCQEMNGLSEKDVEELTEDFDKAGDESESSTSD